LLQEQTMIPHSLPLCELDAAYEPAAFRVQWASGPWMHKEAMRLRRQVFCEEQEVFDGDDADEIDAHPTTRLLVACSQVAGQADEVVGTVRIFHERAGRWWGSRLAVASAWRRHGLLGTSLIRLAVSSARALGCTEFMAHVQARNVPLFRRLRWQPVSEVVLHGRAHCLMRADLSAYSPCEDPYSGYVVARRPHA